jgi:5'-nucleotidase
VIDRWVVVIVLTFVMDTANAAGPQHLNILLTNDDGYDSLGIKAVAEVLREAGHAVTIVAPLGQRSGSGMKVTLGQFALTEHSPGVWSVDASPADAVSIALKHVMRDARPDLVVSGANFGQNLGANVMMSGTVGAAMMAVLDGIPAIAVSVGIKLDEAAAEPQHFPTTVAAFPAAAAWTLAVVNVLADNAPAALLPAGHMLNINYPARGAGENVEARWAAVGQYGGFNLIYPSFDGGMIKSWIEPDARAEADGNRDTALFAAGFATLSVLSPNWNADSVVAQRLNERYGVFATP